MDVGGEGGGPIDGLFTTALATDIRRSITGLRIKDFWRGGFWRRDAEERTRRTAPRVQSAVNRHGGKRADKLVGIDIQALRSRDRNWGVSKARVRSVSRRLGYRLTEVAAYFGRDMATVASLLSPLSDRMQSDGKQRREFGQADEDSRFVKDPQDFDPQDFPSAKIIFWATIITTI